MLWLVHYAYYMMCNKICCLDIICETSLLHQLASLCPILGCLYMKYSAVVSPPFFIFELKSKTNRRSSVSCHSYKLLMVSSTNFKEESCESLQFSLEKVN